MLLLKKECLFGGILVEILPGGGVNHILAGDVDLLCKVLCHVVVHFLHQGPDLPVEERRIHGASNLQKLRLGWKK